MGRFGLYPRLRLDPDHGWRIGRPLWTQTLVYDRHGDLRCYLDFGGVVTEHQYLDRSPGVARARRRFHHAALTLIDLGGLSTRRARQSARNLGRNLDIGRGAWP